MRDGEGSAGLALCDLDAATRDVFAAHGKSTPFDRRVKARSTLYRMWAED